MKDEEYLTLENSYNFLSDCEKNKIIILGIERVIIDEEKKEITYDINGIADFSDATFEESIKASKNFLDHFKDGLFTFVISEDI